MSDVKGRPDVIANAHAAVVTHAQFERAAAAGGPYHPKDGSHSSKTRLRGLVYCESGHRMKVGAYRRDKTHYVCTTEGCTTRVGHRRSGGWTTTSGT